MCNILYINVIYKSKIPHGRNFFFGAFVYFWFLIREYLRDTLDFSWMLNGIIKLSNLQKIEMILIIYEFDVRNKFFF